MKGKILGVDAADGSGAITGDDGARHRFSQADWRGERPPAVGMAVDFEAEDGWARDIYPVAGSSGGFSGVDLSALSGGGASALGDGRIGDLFTRSLATPLALAALAACFLPAIGSPQMDVSLLGLDRALKSVAAPSGAAAEMLGLAGDTSSLGAIKTLVILRFAAPAAALWLIWTAWSGKAERLPLLAAGGAALLGAALIFLTRSAIVSAVPEFARPQFEALVTIGLGAWLLAVAGAAMIAAGLGLIRNPLAKP